MRGRTPDDREDIGVTDRVVDTHIVKLRRKIDVADAASLIRTERGLGYVLHAP